MLSTRAFKRDVRARMASTGERYAVARHQAARALLTRVFGRSEQHRLGGDDCNAVLWGWHLGTFLSNGELITAYIDDEGTLAVCVGGRAGSWVLRSPTAAGMATKLASHVDPATSANYGRALEAIGHAERRVMSAAAGRSDTAERATPKVRPFDEHFEDLEGMKTAQLQGVLRGSVFVISGFGTEVVLRPKETGSDARGAYVRIAECSMRLPRGVRFAVETEVDETGLEEVRISFTFRARRPWVDHVTLADQGVSPDAINFLTPPLAEITVEFDVDGVRTGRSSVLPASRKMCPGWVE